MKIALLIGIFFISMASAYNREASIAFMREKVQENLQNMRKWIKEATEVTNKARAATVVRNTSFGWSILSASLADALSVYLEDPYFFWAYYVTGFAISYGIGFGYPYIARESQPNALGCGIEDFEKALKIFGVQNGMEEVIRLIGWKEAEKMTAYLELRLKSALACFIGDENKESFRVLNRIPVLIKAMELRATVERPQEEL